MMTTWIFCCAKPRDPQNRLGILLQQLLDFCIADDGRAPLRLRGQARAHERACGHKRDDARRLAYRSPADRKCLIALMSAGLMAFSRAT